jgi:hypothetical protein
LRNQNLNLARLPIPPYPQATFVIITHVFLKVKPYVAAKYLEIAVLLMSNSDRILPICLPSGILSPDRQIGYFTNINNGIDAIDLDRGSAIWTTDVAFRPLLATNNWLVGQITVSDRSNAIEIAKFDLDDRGSLLWRSGAIVFPEWVRASQSTHEQYISGKLCWEYLIAPPKVQFPNLP